jgi:hypothetical protein
MTCLLVRPKWSQSIEKDKDSTFTSTSTYRPNSDGAGAKQYRSATPESVCEEPRGQTANNEAWRCHGQHPAYFSLEGKTRDCVLITATLELKAVKQKNVLVEALDAQAEASLSISNCHY